MMISIQFDIFTVLRHHDQYRSERDLIENNIYRLIMYMVDMSIVIFDIVYLSYRLDAMDMIFPIKFVWYESP